MKAIIGKALRLIGNVRLKTFGEERINPGYASI